MSRSLANKTKVQSVVMRFVKGFVAGGLSAVAMTLSGGFTITSVSDIRNLGNVLFVAFVTGGLLAIQKSISWVD